MKRHAVYIFFSLTLTVLGLTLAEEEPSVLVEVAKALLQNQHAGGANGGASGLAAVGGLVQNFLQTDGGRQLGDALMSAAKSQGADSSADLLSGISSLIASAAAGQNENSAGIDPQLIGTVVNMFAGHMNNGDEDIKNINEVDNRRNKRDMINNHEDSAAEMNWGNVLSLAGNFIASQQGNSEGENTGFQHLMNLLPLVMQASGAGQRNGDIAGSKPSVFTPLAEMFSEYWLHFTKSEFGQTLWKTSGLKATAKLFTDKSGRLDMERIYRSLENASFRKRWIRNLSKYIAEWVAHVSDPATQTRFLSTAQFMGNSFLKAQGYPKATLFDPAKPAESLSRVVNAIFKRQFNIIIDSGTYIKPAVSYLQDVYRLGHSQGLSFSHLSPKEMESKLTDTINSEIIEPALRVWRAHRYAEKDPKCNKYVMCFVNKRDNAELSTGLKPGVTKITSIIAAWFLSSSTGTSFLDLYSAVTDDQNCSVQYPANCEDFHAEDIKATTEYTHSEL